MHYPSITMPSPLRALLPLALLALLAGLGACATTTQTTYTRYRLPLGHNPAGAEVARLCAKRCEVTNDYDREGFLSCLRDCPGIEITYGARCGALPTDVKPAALCYTDVRTIEKEPTEADHAAGEAMAGFLGAVIETALAVATESDDDDDHEEPETRESDEYDPLEAGVSKRAETARNDKSSRSPAAPSRSHRRTPAAPKRR